MTVRTMRIHVNKEVSGVDSLAQQFLALADRPSSLLRQLNLLMMMMMMMIIIIIIIIMKVMKVIKNNHKDEQGRVCSGRSTS